MWNSFKILRLDTLKYAHPSKVIQCDTPNGVTVVCFHPLVNYFKFSKMLHVMLMHNVLSLYNGISNIMSMMPSSSTTNYTRFTKFIKCHSHYEHGDKRWLIVLMQSIFKGNAHILTYVLINEFDRCFPF